MMEAVMVAVITGGLSLIGTIITVLAANQKTNHALMVAQAVTDTKLEALKEEVREHNNYAKRMPAVEEKITDLSKRVDRLEAK